MQAVVARELQKAKDRARASKTDSQGPCIPSPIKIIVLLDNIDPNNYYSYNKQQIKSYNIFTNTNYNQDLGLKVRCLKDLCNTMLGSSIAVMSYNS